MPRFLKNCSLHPPKTKSKTGSSLIPWLKISDNSLDLNFDDFAKTPLITKKKYTQPKNSIPIRILEVEAPVNRSAYLAELVRWRNAVMIYQALDTKNKGYIDISEAVSSIRRLQKTKVSSRHIERLVTVLEDLKSFVSSRGVIERDIALSALKQLIDESGLSCSIYGPLRSACKSLIADIKLQKKEDNFLHRNFLSEGVRRQLADEYEWRRRGYIPGNNWDIPPEKLIKPIVKPFDTSIDVESPETWGPIQAPLNVHQTISKLRKETRIAMLKKENEKKEMAECTFKPDLSKLNKNGRKVLRVKHSQKACPNCQSINFCEEKENENDEQVFSYRTPKSIKFVEDCPSDCKDSHNPDSSISHVKSDSILSEDSSSEESVVKMQDTKQLHRFRAKKNLKKKVEKKIWEDPVHFVVHTGYPPPPKQAAWEDTLRDNRENIVRWNAHPSKKDIAHETEEIDRTRPVFDEYSRKIQMPEHNQVFQRGLFLDEFGYTPKMVFAKYDEIDKKPSSSPNKPICQFSRPYLIDGHLYPETNNMNETTFSRIPCSITTISPTKKKFSRCCQKSNSDEYTKTKGPTKFAVCSKNNDNEFEALLLPQISEEEMKKKISAKYPRSYYGDYESGMHHKNRGISEWMHHLRKTAGAIHQLLVNMVNFFRTSVAVASIYFLHTLAAPHVLEFRQTAPDSNSHDTLNNRNEAFLIENVDENKNSWQASQFEVQNSEAEQKRSNIESSFGSELINSGIFMGRETLDQPSYISSSRRSEDVSENSSGTTRNASRAQAVTSIPIPSESRLFTSDSLSPSAENAMNLVDTAKYQTNKILDNRSALEKFSVKNEALLNSAKDLSSKNLEGHNLHRRNNLTNSISQLNVSPSLSELDALSEMFRSSGNLHTIPTSRINAYGSNIRPINGKELLTGPNFNSLTRHPGSDYLSQLLDKEYFREQGGTRIIPQVLDGEYVRQRVGTGNIPQRPDSEYIKQLYTSKYVPQEPGIEIPLHQSGKGYVPQQPGKEFFPHQSGIGSALHQSGIGSALHQSGIGSSLHQSGIGSSLHQSGIGSSLHQSGIGSSLHQSGIGSSLHQSGNTRNYEIPVQYLRTASYPTPDHFHSWLNEIYRSGYILPSGSIRNIKEISLRGSDSNNNSASLKSVEVAEPVLPFIKNLRDELKSS